MKEVSIEWRLPPKQNFHYLLTDWVLSTLQIGKRSQVSIIYSTTIPVIFSVKRYADVLDEVCKRRNIQVNLKTLLVEVSLSAFACSGAKHDL